MCISSAGLALSTFSKALYIRRVLKREVVYLGFN